LTAAANRTPATRTPKQQRGIGWEFDHVGNSTTPALALSQVSLMRKKQSAVSPSEGQPWLTTTARITAPGVMDRNGLDRFIRFRAPAAISGSNTPHQRPTPRRPTAPRPSAYPDRARRNGATRRPIPPRSTRRRTPLLAASIQLGIAPARRLIKSPNADQPPRPNPGKLLGSTEPTSRNVVAWCGGEPGARLRLKD